MRQRILVVASDAALRAALARWLLVAGYAVELAESPKVAREVISHTRVVLAVLVPAGLDAGGTDLARELAGEVEQLIVIEKDASEPDVLGRVRSALAAAPGREPPADQPLRFEGYTLDAGGRTCVDADGRDVTLTRAEFSLLHVLARQPGRVLSRDELSRAAAGRGAEPDDRTVDVLVSRLRRKIEPDPKAPRIIITVPGEGYKLVSKPQAAASAAVAPPATAREADATRPQAGEAPDARLEAVFLRRPRSIGVGRAAAIAAAAFASAAIAGLVMAFWHPGFATLGPAEPAQKFDASVIPLVNDDVRWQLAGYVTRPNAKALAISAAPRSGWGLAFGAADLETAKRQALERCTARSTSNVCSLYAVGMDVVWLPASLPLPMAADIHAEPLDIRFDAADIPTLRDTERSSIAEKFTPLNSHKALAIGPRRFYWNSAADRAQAVRLTIERCGDILQTPCLLLSVDGLLTTQITKSNPIAGIFMLSTEPEMDETERQRLAPIYAGKDWRALVRGHSGHWYAVAGEDSEAAAVEAALKTCRGAEPDCTLHAIGNWRIGRPTAPEP